jgi:hypothetical protein
MDQQDQCPSIAQDFFTLSDLCMGKPSFQWLRTLINPIEGRMGTCLVPSPPVPALKGTILGFLLEAKVINSIHMTCKNTQIPF